MKKILFPVLFIFTIVVLFSFFAQEVLAATEILRPNAAGDVTNIESQYPSFGAHWDKVDESTADTTTYVFSAVGGFRSDLYNLPNHTGSGTINFVKLYYGGRCVGSACTVCGYLKTNNEEYPSGDCIQVVSWTTYSRQYDTNPYTKLAWTWAEIDALQIGGYIGGADAANAAQLTQVYVEIDYTPTGAPTVTNSIGASNISTDSARLNGEITGTGGETPTARIYWGDNDGGTNAASWDYVEDLGIQSGTFYKDISGLNPGTGYYYRCYVSNSYGSDWADDTETFLTQSETGGTVFYGTASDALLREVNDDSSSTTSWNIVHDATSASYVYTDQGSLTVQVRTWYDPGWYQTIINRPVVYFNTSLPDDATITSAVLKLYGTLDGSHRQEYGPFTIQVQSGMSTYPHDPAVASDYYYTRYDDNVGILSLEAIGTGSGYREVELNSTGVSLINKTGTTKFMLREKEHDADDVKPSYPAGRYDNLWSFSSYEGGNPPILEITYTTPATAPTVTTELATITLSTNQATLKGKVTATGGEDPDHRYIDWDTDASGEPYANTVDLGAGGTGEFSAPLTLTPGTIYYYRARAHNSAGDGKGSERKVVIYQASGGQQSFTTLSPPDFTISASPTTLRGPKVSGASDPQTTVTVNSLNSFNSAVTLSVRWCTGTTDTSCVQSTPAGLTSSFSATPIAPPANGSISSTLSIDTNNPATGNYYLRVRGASGSLTHDTSVISLTIVDLSVSLIANPNSGTAPLNGVDLTATVGGSATGTINYKFDCTSDGTWDYTFDNISDNPKTVVDACDYVSAAIYTAKVRAERDVANPAEATTEITVNPGDTTSPTTTIKIIRTSTEEDVTAAESWLRADTYTIQFVDNDPEPNPSGLKYCEYSVYVCDVGGTNCITEIEPLQTRACNSSTTIEAGTSPYDLEGLGRYRIFSIAIDNADNSGTDYKYLNFDFKPPETRIE